MADLETVHATIDHTGITGAGVADILDLPTAEMDDTLVLAPDGAGGVEFRAESGGGGGAAELLAIHAYAPGSDGAIGQTSSTSFVDVDATNAAITFTAPASGNVLVVLSGAFSDTGQYFWGLREATSNIGTPMELSGSAITHRHTGQARIYLTGVSAGSHTYKWSHRVASGVGSPWGGPNAGQILLEVWAAP